MKYIEFQEQLFPFKIFSIDDIRKKAPRFDTRRLVEWQQKGYIQKIINRWYFFSGIDISEQTLFLMANKIYSPSYISFESALAWHGLIPEGVFSVVSATSKKTKTFMTSQGAFFYRRIKPSLYFGYRLERWDKQFIRMADPEKALLDYLYLHPEIKSLEDFEAWRINADWLYSERNQDKLEKYLRIFSNKALDKRVKALLEFSNYAQS